MQLRLCHIFAIVRVSTGTRVKKRERSKKDSACCSRYN